MFYVAFQCIKMQLNSLSVVDFTLPAYCKFPLE